MPIGTGPRVRFSSILTGLSIEELNRDFPGNFSPYDDEIVNNIKGSNFTKGTALGLILSHAVFWTSGYSSAIQLIIALIIIYSIGLYCDRQALIGQYYRLLKLSSQDGE
jgi:hypothetical protein